MPSIRGDAARTWFYMSDRYGVLLSSELRDRLEQWADADPVDRGERRRHDRIPEEMGWSNPHVVEEE